MRKHIGMVVLATLVLLLLLVYTVAFQVSQLSDLVVLTTFGKTTKVLSGRQGEQSGLHFKWLYPVEEEVRYDARTFLMESPLEEMSTQDKKNVMVSFFCAWRIDDANRFLPSIKTTEAAQDKVKSIIRDAMGQIIGKSELSELINTDPAKMKLSEIESEVTRVASPKLKDEFGVGVVMIGVKRLGLNADVSKTVIDTMKAERQAKAAEYQASGEARATAIRERARAASEKILAFADRKAKDIRGEGDRAAAEYYAKFQGNEDLAIFLRSLEAMRKALPNRSVMLLDESSMPFLKWFRSTPTAESLHQMTTSQPAVPASVESPAAKPPAVGK